MTPEREVTERTNEAMREFYRTVTVLKTGSILDLALGLQKAFEVLAGPVVCYNHTVDEAGFRCFPFYSSYKVSSAYGEGKPLYAFPQIDISINMTRTDLPTSKVADVKL